MLNAAHGISGGLAEESFATIERRLNIPRQYITERTESLTSATFFMTAPGEIPPDQDPRDRARVLYSKLCRITLRLWTALARCGAGGHARRAADD